LLLSSLCIEQVAAHECIGQQDFCCDQCCEQNNGRFSLRGDALYWRPYISGIELCFGDGLITQTTGDTTVFHSREFDADPHFNWDAGYRIAAGYEMAKKWGFGVEWTHFQGDGHRRSFFNGDITSHGKFNVKLDQIDIVAGYDYAVNCNFNVKPFIGARIARIKDGVKGIITTQLLIDDVPAIGEIRHFHHKQNYEAAGLLLGINGDYNIGCGFGVYGTAAASLLYSNIKVSFHDKTFLGTVVDTEINTFNRRHIHSFDPNIDLALGLFWKTGLFQCAELNMRFGFEHHEYFNQNHFSVFRGDMSFTGGIFSIDIAL
jgi:hypothetical protein